MALSKTEKRKSWENTIALNNLEGEYTPSNHLLKLIDRQIDGEINYDEMVSELIESYKKEINN